MHIPVLLHEVLGSFDPSPGQIFVDMTLGTGGHAEEILKRINPGGKLIAFEHDERNQLIAEKRLKKKYPSLVVIPKNFSCMQTELQKKNIDTVDGILFDLGISSLHVDDPARGFSFRHNGPLDMRMDLSLQTNASDIINTASENELSEIFKNFGEEKRHFFYSRKIVERRNSQPFSSTKDLSEFIISHSSGRKKHPAKLIFQALRIAVNHELENLQKALPQAVNLLKPSGKIVVISFHSLEDRLVKEFFRSHSDALQKKQKYPSSQSVQKPSPLPLRVITKRAILPSRKEIEKNPRARSARMRVAKRTSSPSLSLHNP